MLRSNTGSVSATQLRTRQAKAQSCHAGAALATQHTRHSNTKSPKARSQDTPLLPRLAVLVHGAAHLHVPQLHVLTLPLLAGTLTDRLLSASWAERPGTPGSAQRGEQCCKTNQRAHGTAQHTARHSTGQRDTATSQAIDKTQQQYLCAPAKQSRQRLNQQPAAAVHAAALLWLGCDHRPYCF